MTLRRGLLSLVFRPRRTVQAILVINDISESMRVWRSKVDTFPGDLRRQGLSDRAVVIRRGRASSR